MAEHMYYNDLPCWCGRPESFTGPPFPHNLTPSADLPACRDEDPATPAVLAAAYPDPHDEGTSYCTSLPPHSPCDDPPEYQHPDERESTKWTGGDDE